MKDNFCPDIIKVTQKVYNWNIVDVAHAETTNMQNTNTQNISYQTITPFTAPFYFLIMMFFLFAVIMSMVYIYHWIHFSFGDMFIRNFMYVFLFGLFILAIPLLYLVLK